MEKTIEEVVKTVEQLPQDQLKQFRNWFQKFDAEIWNEQIEEDIKTGKLDAFAQAAIADYASSIHGDVNGELLALAYEETIPLVMHFQLKRFRIVQY